jgi:hypothetical protein
MQIDRLKRREFITLLGGATAWPLAGRAQQRVRTRRIGVLSAIAADDPQSQARNGAFLQGLGELGWNVGRNLQIDYRWDGGRNPSYAAELVALAPEVILAMGSSVVVPLLQVSRTIPVVFTQVSDPVGSGFVTSLARTGGNATGFYHMGVRHQREMDRTTQGNCAASDASGRPFRSQRPHRVRHAGRNPVRGAFIEGQDKPDQRPRPR